MVETDLNLSAFHEDGEFHILFVKRSNGPLNLVNITSSLDVLSLKGSPVDSLYNSLKGIWCPALLQSEGPLLSKVQRLLSDLEAALGQSVKPASQGDNDMNNVSGISGPEDEVRFWERLVDDRRSPYKQLASQVQTALSAISKSFSDLVALEISEVEELIDRTLDALNEVWGSGDPSSKQYPKARMQHMFDCIGLKICRYIQKKLASCGLWTETPGTVRSKLQAAINLCEQWSAVPRRLTTSFWPNSDNPWKGPFYEDTYTMAFKLRLESIQSIRTLAEELSELLPKEEKSSFHMNKLFEPLDAVKPLQFNPYTESVWAEAVRNFHRSIDPIEGAVTSQLKKKVGGISDNPQLLLRELQKYTGILSRPSVRRLLSSEREALLTHLSEYIKSIESGVDIVDGGNDESDDEGPGGMMGSSLVAEIITLRQLGARVIAVCGSCAPVLSDLSGWQKFSDANIILSARIKTEQDTRFKNWVVDMEEKFASDSSSLKLSGSLMGWKDGLLVVNFSEELVVFLRELRQLDELGYEVPKATSRKKGLADRAVEAEKYYRYGILLKKTANFYNSMSEQMVDVQENLLLESLSAFAALVSKPSLTRSGGEVTWANPAECENYIRALQEAAEKLSSENRWLRKMHESLMEQTVVLMGMDLLRQTDSWKARWRLMKERMQTVRSKYSEKDSRTWVLHCDHQMYKALEASYQALLRF